ncbi:MAG: MotA/TolQ/ExbB proton channel family protein [Endomicrobiales bacterium]
MGQHLVALQSIIAASGTYVIYLLILCSIVAFAVIIERMLIVIGHSSYQTKKLLEMDSKLEPGTIDQTTRWSKPESVIHAIAADLLQHRSQGKEILQERLEVQLTLQRRRLEKRIVILGTLGNNAPFIGLLGTVLGVIHAFQNLAIYSGQGPEVVMAGLADALIATALGIVVALPCVASYNFLQRKINDIINDADHFGKKMIMLMGVS